MGYMFALGGKLTTVNTTNYRSNNALSGYDTHHCFTKYGVFFPTNYESLTLASWIDDLDDDILPLNGLEIGGLLFGYGGSVYQITTTVENEKTGRRTRVKPMVTDVTIHGLESKDFYCFFADVIEMNEALTVAMNDDKREANIKKLQDTFDLFRPMFFTEYPVEEINKWVIRNVKDPFIRYRNEPIQKGGK